MAEKENNIAKDARKKGDPDKIDYLYSIMITCYTLLVEMSFHINVSIILL
jgi:hypothetical protein